MPMNYEQRAAQIWSVLVLAARNQQVLSYLQMESMTGLPKHLMAPILGKIERYCDIKHLPKLTAILVNEKDGVPGYLYPGYADDRNPGDEMYVQLFKEQSRVFIFDWLKGGAPSEEELRSDSAS